MADVAARPRRLARRQLWNLDSVIEEREIIGLDAVARRGFGDVRDETAPR
jgi:hypothetical protein